MTAGGTVSPSRSQARSVVAALRAGIVWLLVLPVRIYQLFISPLLGPRCRFYPSCSRYAVVALQTHGPLRGLYLAGWRLLRCNPWNPGGVDDVPPAGQRRRTQDVDSPSTSGLTH